MKLSDVDEPRQIYRFECLDCGMNIPLGAEAYSLDFPKDHVITMPNGSIRRLCPRSPRRLAIQRALREARDLLVSIPDLTDFDRMAVAESLGFTFKGFSTSTEVR